MSGTNLIGMTLPMDHELRIRLDEIVRATNNFHKDNLIANGGFGSVYRCELSLPKVGPTMVAVKRLDPESAQGGDEFIMEIETLSIYKHENLISLKGFCEEESERILVYTYESNGSLDKHISSTNLNWVQRLNISTGIARCLDYLHTIGPHHTILHRDVKSANILLNDKWEAKVSDFGLSDIAPLNLPDPNVGTSFVGTYGYVAPEYFKTGTASAKSDVYSFGVVLFEILCGRLVNGKHLLAPLARNKYEQDKLDDIIQSDLKKQMNLNCLDIFAGIAYQCIKFDPRERPTMAYVIEKLENAHHLQTSLQTPEIARVETWGSMSTQKPENQWDFRLQESHKLKMITITHGYLIYSLNFISESNGAEDSTTVKAGGRTEGGEPEKIEFEEDEEIIGIEGTVGITQFGITVISSLSFVTNKKTHPPYGRKTKSRFFARWDKGTFGGFYGVGGYYIDSIGVYLKASSNDIPRVRISEMKYSTDDDDYQWCFKLERNGRLKKISIDHGDLVYSMVFTPEYRGIEKNSYKAGGLYDGNIVSEVTFAWDEEIIAIIGTIDSNYNMRPLGDPNGYPAISSISFITSKKCHGPYGRATTEPFSVRWNKGTFAGFYGLARYHINDIGVYLKATI